jgi:hypothetical protein
VFGQPEHHNDKEVPTILVKDSKPYLTAYHLVAAEKWNYQKLGKLWWNYSGWNEMFGPS